MDQKRLWIVGGVLFLVSALVSLLGDEIGTAAAFLAIGVLFIAMPSYLERNDKR